jgi:hypothetical protein
MSKSKPYSAVPVNRVVLESVSRGRAGQEVVVGFDIGKYEILAVPRWGNNDFGRPWLVANPEQIAALVKLLGELARSHPLRVALEPSGADGDPLRQACHDAGLPVWRVSDHPAQAIPLRRNLSPRWRSLSREVILACSALPCQALFAPHKQARARGAPG